MHSFLLANRPWLACTFTPEQTEMFWQLNGLLRKQGVDTVLCAECEAPHLPGTAQAWPYRGLLVWGQDTPSKNRARWARMLGLEVRQIGPGPSLQVWSDD